LIDTTHYTYRVTWSASDQEFVGLVAELPSLSWLARDQVAALQGIRELVTTVVAEMREANESIPIPFAERPYSGEFKLRIPPELHRSLAVRAAEENVSLNRLVSSRLGSAT
jgi:predicted HicB family RNase H-like nuclease